MTRSNESFSSSAQRAKRRARGIDFNCTVDQSTLNVPVTSTIRKPQKYSGQRVRLKIYVPEGTKVVDELENTVVSFRSKEKTTHREWVAE